MTDYTFTETTFGVYTISDLGIIEDEDRFMCFGINVASFLFNIWCWFK